VCVCCCRCRCCCRHLTAATAAAAAAAAAAATSWQQNTKARKDERQQKCTEKGPNVTFEILLKQTKTKLCCCCCHLPAAKHQGQEGRTTSKMHGKGAQRCF